MGVAVLEETVVPTLANVLTETAISSGGESNFRSLYRKSDIKVFRLSLGMCLETQLIIVKTLSIISLGQSRRTQE